MYDSVLTNLLMNFLFIVVGLLLFAIYYDTTKKQPSKGIVILLSTITILLCVMFSYKLANGIYVDLRRIPFFLASLYFGPVVSFVLMIMIIAIRYFIIGSGLIHLVILNYFVTFLILAAFSKGFLRAKRKVKMLFLVIICFSMTIFNLLFGYIHEAEITMDEYLYLVLIPLAATVISVMIAEMIRKLMEMKKTLSQHEKLQVLSRLAASLSHEIRNPLTSSKGFLQLVQEEKDEKIQKEFIHLSLKGIDQATHVIEEYLTFTNSTPEKAESIDVKDSLMELIEIVKPKAPHISFRYQLLDGVHVEGQRHNFIKCMGNIMTNAIESMPQGGQVSIGVIEKEKVIISISDSGKGMTDEQIRRFGEPFFTTKDEGTGLGIMAATIIVHSMKGKMEVESELNKGTTVMIELQRAIKTEAG
ncbi:HAMP domain-containing sensor histidine kinase [Bacillus sp. es.034]|uniref:sensor histidine kinase n=1 Tax=Bacillus sp. es.034 TaxID=1761763 RepID=UPI000BF5A25D|nr:HAMP domain-containing sensor histidine kinase [Bacillus sp. es.034]PFG07429.1 two-component system sporulation sensor kinase B [Bacillus sp. es.034]